MDKVVICSSQVYLSEENTDPDKYMAKFILCDFGRNKNGTALDRDTIENWMGTIVDNPLVGKIKMKYDGTFDFSGHNVTIVTKEDEDGNEYQEAEFDTDAFGAFKNVEISEIDGKEYLIATCVIWKRFTTACSLILKRIKDGTLYTSWEIAVEKSHKGIVDGFMTKIINAGRFIGHCLLAKDINPAYDSSHLLEIASTNYDVEFAEALSQDIISQGLDIDEKVAKEEEVLQENIKENVAEETVVETPVAETEENITTENSEVIETVVKKEKTDETEASALTEYDLRKKIREVCRAKIDKWCWISFHFPVEKEVWLEVEGRESELDFVRMTYTAENDTITVSEPEDVKLSVSVKSINTTVSEYEKTIAEKDELIVKVSSEITTLKSDNTELSQYKEKFEKAEQEKIKAELNEKKNALVASVIKSGQITKSEIEKSEELSALVDNLDKKSLMAIVGERLLASVDNTEQESIETSETVDVHVASNLNNEDDETVDKASIMRKFLRK